MIKVSIIIPVYNVASFIEQCLQSVYNQTYTNIEVLIVDDCGQDNSMELVEAFINKISDSRFKVIHHPTNKGLSAARNTGIRQATGDFLYFIDSDDFITESCIQTFVELIKEHPDSEVVFGSAVFFPNAWGGFCLNVKSQKIPLYSNNRRWINTSFLKHNYLPIIVPNKLISKDFILKNKLFFKDGIIYEDQLYLFIMANACSRVSFNKTDTYFYRNNPKSIMHKYGIKEMDSEIIIIKECLRHINYNFFFYNLLYIIHIAHKAYCRRYGSSESIYIRYPKAFMLLIKSIFMKPEQLRK